MKTVALIVNPRASRVSAARTREVQAVLAREAHVTTIPTERRGHASELAREAAGRHDAIVVFSGDGGFNEALNGLDERAPVAFLPGGGTSVLPRALGLPRDPVRAAERVARALAEERVRTIALGRVNGRRFAFSAGIGLDAEIVRRVDARGRSLDGRRPGDAYFAWTLARILAERRGRFGPAMEVAGAGRAAFAFVANTDPYTYLGRVPLHVAPEARFEAGLDVVAPVSVGPREIPRILGSMLAGGAHTRAANILHLHDVETVELVCDRPMPLQVDGEDLGDVMRAAFELERDAVDVVV